MEIAAAYAMTDRSGAGASPIMRSYLKFLQRLKAQNGTCERCHRRRANQGNAKRVVCQACGLEDRAVAAHARSSRTRTPHTVAAARELVRVKRGTGGTPQGTGLLMTTTSIAILRLNETT